ncbi:MAG TPA: hypothetical protein VFP58_01495 [Candidatus Eisenbacteria bacterium]|nr:hypothetical protein [Candidatus Eisenbacteria bacterium]
MKPDMEESGKPSVYAWAALRSLEENASLRRRLSRRTRDLLTSPKNTVAGTTDLS